MRIQPRSCSVAGVVHRQEVRVREGRHRDANRTVPPMDVLTPRSLAEALELKAEHPEALPIQGGTDVMVALNFDRARPEVVLNLNEVAELRGWARDDGVGPARRRADLQRGDGGRARRRAAGSRGGVPHGRLAADPEPRHDRREPRHGLAGGRRAAAASRRGRRGRVRVGAGIAAGAARRVRHRREADGARARRADRGRVAAAVGRAADVHEDRAAERDGDRRLLARLVGRRRAARLVRVGEPAPGARDRAARRGRHRSPSASPRRPRRSTTSAAAPRTAAMRSGC